MDEIEESKERYLGTKDLKGLHDPDDLRAEGMKLVEQSMVVALSIM